MKTSNGNLGDILLAKLESLGNWIVKHAKIVMPVVLAACVIITVVISIRANKKDAEQQEDVAANSTLEETTDEVYVVPEVALQENTVPEITELISTYYEAQAAGDVDTIRSLVSDIEDSEVLRIVETSKYVEAYPSLEIYTKTGPVDNTYIVYVCSELKFTDYDDLFPGMKVFYVCVDGNGRYYINESEEGSENDLTYIREVTLQDDVVDLNNKVAAAYNDMVAENPDLAQFILDLNDEIKKNVGGALAQESEEEAGGEEAGTKTETAEGTGTGPEVVVTKVRAIDVVNIRSSDSETADRLGKAAVGDEFKLLEKIGNGWSKIEYEGAEAYIKSEFLEDIETEVADNSEGGNDGGQEAEQEPEEDNAAETNGTVMVIENVRIRSAASENSEKLGTAYAGEKLELIMKQADGWTKIRYNGKTAYVKSDYVK
ncbi:MAG: SH3 domain-containing protein [Blautia sp.]|nr:SH3 domain-containing protein [Blautia sp.]MCM1202505.1 SH3 domain-containing protein [Bacteroides fragilis]